MINLKGKDRNLFYELNFAEGNQLTADINHLKIKAFHTMSCMLAYRINPHMEKFIFGGDEAPYNSPNTTYVLDLSSGYLRPNDDYSEPTHRSNFLQLIVSYFPQRKTTNKLLLSDCRLGLKELG